MPHGRISVPVYAALGKILDPSGPGVSFNEMDDVVIPVQDLSRIMQRSQVQHLVYHLNQDLIADATTEVQWADLSDWTAVAANNIPVGSDADLPAADGTKDRLLIGVSLFISDNISEWDSSVVRRVPATVSAQVAFAVEFLKATRNAGNCIPSVPNLLPIVLAPGEAGAELSTDITFAAGVTLDWIIEILAAPEGVMAAYPGV